MRGPLLPCFVVLPVFGVVGLLVLITLGASCVLMPGPVGAAGRVVVGQCCPLLAVGCACVVLTLVLAAITVACRSEEEEDTKEIQDTRLQELAGGDQGGAASIG